MKKAFVCEALEEYAKAFPDSRQQTVAVVGTDPSISDELRCSHLFCAFVGLVICVHVHAGSRTGT